MEQFQKLGALIEDRWRKENYSELVFPDIASEALTDAQLSSKVDPWDIVRWVHQSPTLPEQKDVAGRFGNPPITLFSGHRFYIDVYYWLEGTTSIHQHSFTGAFQVLLGSSIHSHYNFHEDRILNEHFSVGELTLKSVELLRLNDIKEIRPGSQYIHSLFHLDHPSATITVRTQHTPSEALQYNYAKPYFALNPFFQSAGMVKKIQTVTLLLSMKHKDADRMISDLIASSDFHTSYAILLEAGRYLRSNQLDKMFGLATGRQRFDAIVEEARMVHGSLVEKFLAVLEEQERQQQIIRRRQSITSEEHRFFLALLLNVAGRENILALVKQRFPETDPVEKVLDWVEELGQTRVLGSNEPNALGIEGFSDEHVLVLEHQLQGKPISETKKIFASGRDGITEIETRLETITRSLENAPLFQHLLERPQVTKIKTLAP